MSKSLVLEFTQKWLRDKYKWDNTQCGVQYQSIPSYSAGDFFVSIDEAGVESGREDTESLKESVGIRIGVWKRPEHFMVDQLGQLRMPDDKYQIMGKTLNDLDRQVTVFNKGQNKFGLHKNYEFLRELNSFYNLPHEELGGHFTEPFKFRGSGAIETKLLDGSNKRQILWFGYIITFRGFTREQRTNSTNAYG